MVSPVEISTMQVTYYGHSCFGVRVAGRDLLFDPFVSGNPLAHAVALQKIPAHYLLVSHGHDDHLLDAVAVAQRTGATLIAPFEVGEWFTKQGLKSVHAMNHGGSLRLDFGRVKLVNAVHSSMLPDGSYGGNPAGFVVETAEGNFYYSGDTALTLDMKLIGETTPLRFAALCLGDYFTMGVDDAVRAAGFIRCDEILGVHFDSFPPIRIDHAAAVEQFRAAGKRLHLLKPGEQRDF
jgi:L-ascorbate metabolism protein UlaG (beta-lactamase superfamily)